MLKPDVPYELLELTLSQARSRLQSSKFSAAISMFRHLVTTHSDIIGQDVAENILDGFKPDVLISEFVPMDMEEKDIAQSIFWMARNMIAEIEKVRKAAEQRPSGRFKEAHTAMLRFDDVFHSIGRLLSVGGSSVPMLNVHLERFFPYKKHFHKKDLMQYENMNELRSAYRFALPRIQAEIDSKRHKESEAGTEKIIDDTTWAVYIPHNKDAACELGKGTAWCTAAPLTNYFRKYHKPDDPLFIFVRKSDPSEKYQVHFGTQQFMNRGNEPVDLATSSDLRDILIRHGLHRRFPIISKEEPSDGGPQ